jgi:hypothetical protein
VLDSTGAEASNPGCPRSRGSGTALYLFSCDLPLGPGLPKSGLDKLGPRKLLALTLLVTRVALADHHDVAVTTNHAALLTDGLDAGVDLHCVSLSLSSIRLRLAG